PTRRSSVLQVEAEPEGDGEQRRLGGQLRVGVGQRGLASGETGGVVGQQAHDRREAVGVDVLVHVQCQQHGPRGGRGGDPGLVRAVEGHGGRRRGRGLGRVLASGQGRPGSGGAEHGEASGGPEQSAPVQSSSLRFHRRPYASPVRPGRYSSSPPSKSLATAVNSSSEPSSNVRVTVTSSPATIGALKPMSMRWSPPGASSCEPPAGTVKPSGTSRIIAAPSSSTTSCSSIAARSLSAATRWASAAE